MNIKEEFLKYTSSFKEEGCIYKEEHTFRVVNFAKEIAKSLSLNDDDIYLVELCSLLHDIGRFEQMHKYHTFVDKISKYHGDIGIEVLLNNNFIDKFCKNHEEKSLVLKTCKYHGTLEVPKTLSEKERLIINIVRDSDKIDIINNAYLGNIKLDIGNDLVTEPVKKEFYRHGLVNMQNKCSKIDRLIVWLAFTYDYNFKYTYEYLKSSKIMDKLILKYINKTDNIESKKELKQMGKEINNYIESRL